MIGSLTVALLGVWLTGCVLESPQAAEEAEADATRARVLLDKAEQWAATAEYDSARVYVRQARRLYRRLGDSIGVVEATIHLGSYAAQARAFDEALTHLREAQDLAHRFDNAQSMRARVDSELGEVYYRRASLDTAMAFLQQALEWQAAETQPQEASEATYLADTHERIGLVYYDRGAYDEAMTHQKRALELRQRVLGEQSRAVATSYRLIGNLHLYQGDYDQALSMYNRAASIQQAVLGEQHADLASTYNNIGIIYRRKADYDRALQMLNRVLSIREGLPGNHQVNIARTYNNLGNIYQDKQDFTQALLYYERALSIFRALSAGSDTDVAAILDNIGVVHQEIRAYDRALEYYEQALQVRLAVQGPEHVEVAETYDSFGSVYALKGDYEQALAYHRKALAIQARQGAQFLGVAETRRNFASVYHKMGAYEQALAECLQARSIFRLRLGDRHPDLAATYGQMGEVYQATGRVQEAIASYQEALRANVPAFASRDPYVNPQVEDALSERQLLETLGHKANALAQRAASSPNRRTDLEAALETYDRALYLLDRMRRGYTTESAKLLLADKNAELYEQAIQTALHLYDQTGEIRYRDEAFKFVQQSKVGVLLGALAEVESKEYAGLPDSLLDQERALRIDIAFYERTLANEQSLEAEADPAVLERTKNRLFEARQAYEALVRSFERLYPDYFNLKYQQKTVTLQELQQQVIDEQTTLVEYFLGPDSVTVFTLTPATVNVTTTARAPDLEEHIAGLREGITARSFDAFTGSAHRLYQLLVAPIRPYLQGDHLIIVPDGRLGYVPFETLITRPPASEADRRYHRLPYLVESFAVSYAYSSTLLLEIKTRERTQAERDFMAFAPIFQDIEPPGGPDVAAFRTRGAEATRSSGWHLPATRQEVTAIERLFADRYGVWDRWFSDRAEVYLEQEAHEGNLKAGDITAYRYLHLATHGLINEARPALSALVLAPGQEADEDGWLYLGEIYNLRLKADLVVLSACETGLGRIARGEGIIGLTRGFFYAGAANVMVSLWKVNDTATAGLMVDFYARMLDGPSKARALQQAKQSMIHERRYAEPFYWSPFILIGSG